MSETSARCSNGHDVLGIGAGTPCPQCGDTVRHVSITVTDSATVSDAAAVGRVSLSGSGSLTAGAAGTASLELKASGSGSGTFGWSGKGDGVAPPVVNDVQEVLLRWTPLDDTTGTWMLEVHRGGETITVGVGDTFVRAIARVVKDLYPDVGPSAGSS